jgi:hypothetical protein
MKKLVDGREVDVTLQEIEQAKRDAIEFSKPRPQPRDLAAELDLLKQEVLNLRR